MPFENVPDQQLLEEARALELQLDALRKVRKRFREDAHATLNLSVKAARDRVDALLRSGVYQLAHSVGQAIAIPGLADAMAMTDPDVVKRWRQLIDAEPGGDSAGATFGPLTRAEYTAERTRLDREIRDRAHERARRIEARRHEAAVAELEASPEAALAFRTERAPEPGEPGYGAHIHSAATGRQEVRNA